MKTITIDGVEYILTQKDENYRCTDNYNIIGILKVSKEAEKIKPEGGFSCDYTEGKVIIMKVLGGYDEILDFYKNGKYSTRLSKDFYDKANRIADCLGWDVKVYLSDKPEQPVLFWDDSKKFGIVVAPRVIDENSNFLPIGYGGGENERN